MFLQAKLYKARVLRIFFFFCRVLASYILYPGPYLENKGNHQHNKRSLFKQKGTLFFILGILKRENSIFITF